MKSSLPYTISNGVSPVRIWHRPVTIKNETLSFTPPPIPVFVMSLRLNFDMYCLKQIDAADLRDSSRRPAQMTRGPPTSTNDQRPTSQSYEWNDTEKIIQNWKDKEKNSMPLTNIFFSLRDTYQPQNVFQSVVPSSSPLVIFEFGHKKCASVQRRIVAGLVPDFRRTLPDFRWTCVSLAVCGGG